MAPTPSSKSLQTPSKTPLSKHRLHFNPAKNTCPSPIPTSMTKETVATEHPVEVISRIRDYPDQKEKPISALHISSDRRNIRVRTDIGYRDFTLDGVSVSEEEDLDGFYKKFVESRINDVKLGAKCTIMMYGPTGAGKSHTMFGCSKQPGIVYRALRDILGEGESVEEDSDGGRVGLGCFVQVTVLEIYNEEIYDLLASNNGGGGLGFGWPKGNTPKVRLEVMGKKAKNATFISGNEAGKISREVAKVEKRRIVKSTLCNERSSRSHCMIILEVPTVGGRLMLVDMAGSENIEQAGQTGFEAKMQTAKINQGNIALKRVVESIANGDSHVPFRDSKLTMLLQDSFEDDKSKILMILCASPDPKEMHKTIATLEYGAKAKCIVRGGHTPNKDKMTEDSSAVILGSRIAAMDQFILKLQMENKQREKEQNEAHKELMRKEEEVTSLRAKLEMMEQKGPIASEEEINMKVKERTQNLKLELERKLLECQKMANEFVELGRKRMEEKILQQQLEVEILRRRLEEIEAELSHSREINGDDSGLVQDTDGSSFARRLLEIYADEDPGMEKSMDIDMGRSMDFDSGDQKLVTVHDVKVVDKGIQDLLNPLTRPTSIAEEEEEESDFVAPNFIEKVHLSTVFEEDEEEEEGERNGNKLGDEEVEKGIVEETAVSFRTNGSLIAPRNHEYSPSSWENFEQTEFYKHANYSEVKGVMDHLADVNYKLENGIETASARRTRIQNIFMLCGNHRELAKHVRIPTPSKKRSEATEKDISPIIQEVHDSLCDRIGDETRNEMEMTPSSGRSKEPVTPLKLLSDEHNFRSSSSPQLTQYNDLKENARPESENKDGHLEVYVKWEASKEYPGKFISKFKVAKDSRLGDLRKMVENHLGVNENKQSFTFLMLGDPTGAPVLKEKEAGIQVSNLPVCNRQSKVHLACLRPVKAATQQPNNCHLPLTSLENKLQFQSSFSMEQQNGEGLSPKVVGQQSISQSPYVSVGLHR